MINNSHETEGIRNLPPLEAHIASLCVAIVSGGLGGALSTLIAYHNRVAGITIPTWYEFGFAGALGFGVSWIVCEILFPSAHHWYGSKSWEHRVYDLMGIVGGVLGYLVIN